jgi:energy-coupling factor transporter ATP-binding protein EcfA2
MICPVFKTLSRSPVSRSMRTFKPLVNFDKFVPNSSLERKISEETHAKIQFPVENAQRKKTLEQRDLPIHPTFPKEKQDSKRFSHNTSYPKKPPLFLFLSLFAAAGIATTDDKLKAKSSEESSLDEIPEEFEKILRKEPDKRQLAERVKLYRFILNKGLKIVEKAKDKDIVILSGSTDAGKSTLINFLNGCTMKKIDEKIVVDPNSPIKEVAKIGVKLDACTLFPKEIEVPFVFFNAPPTIDTLPIGKKLVFYDMPGLNDNRGVEVELANTVVTQKLINNAKSIKLVFLFEGALITPERCASWKKFTKILQEKFGSVLKDDKNSFSLFITKTNNINKVKNDIINSQSSIGFSERVSVYDPLDPIKRPDLLQTILARTSHNKLNVKAVIADEHYQRARDIGNLMSKEVDEYLKHDLQEQNIDKIKDYLEFINSIGCINEKLKDSEKAVQLVFDRFSRQFSDEINPIITPNLYKQMNAKKAYDKMRALFEKYISFENSNQQINLFTAATTDARPPWGKHPLLCALGSGVGSVISITAGACIFPIPVVGLMFGGLLVTAGTGAAWGAWECTKRWWSPSQEDKDKAFFFDYKLQSNKDQQKKGWFF